MKTIGFSTLEFNWRQDMIEKTGDYLDVVNTPEGDRIVWTRNCGSVMLTWPEFLDEFKRWCDERGLLPF